MHSIANRNFIHLYFLVRAIKAEIYIYVQNTLQKVLQLLYIVKQCNARKEDHDLA
jgi:hypothetical protein